MTLDSERERPDDLVQSVARAFRVLEVVTRFPGLPVKAIARRSGLNLSTTYHLVRTLAYEGYVTRLKDGTYDVGEQVSHRFYEQLGSLGRGPNTREVLRHLAQSSGYSAYLGRISAGRVVVVDYAEAPGSPYIEDLERGLDVSAHATALGKALLLGMSRRERHELVVEAGMRKFTPRTAADMSSLDAQLARLRPDGVVEEHGEFRNDIACAAHLVPKRGGGDTAWAVGLSIPGEVVPPHARRELSLVAGDLTGI
ncbi:IclR family transcriptional regulator [Promicromonospora sukumoe]|uniref:IclR family transcriptional regulator n=1 Tax=Promicromonospora sukumoe TaxID=88382 RepID=UPI0037CB844A